MKVPELRFDEIFLLLRLLDQHMNSLVKRAVRVKREADFRCFWPFGRDHFMMRASLEMEMIANECRRISELADSLRVASGTDDDGREMTFDEWRLSQAWQAMSGYEAYRKKRWLDYDGMVWCTVDGGA